MKFRPLLAATLSVFVLASACDAGGGGDNEFSEDFRRLFMENCTDEESEEFCICYLGELEDRFTQEEIMSLAIEGTDEPPPEFFEAGFACAQFLDG
jgi:hypothetical protein